jgi:hypothetical protein
MKLANAVSGAWFIRNSLGNFKDFCFQRLGVNRHYFVQSGKSAVRAGRAQRNTGSGSEVLQHYLQILSSPLIPNQPSGVCEQYRADHYPTPYAERGSFEALEIRLKIFQHHWQNFSFKSP